MGRVLRFTALLELIPLGGHPGDVRRKGPLRHGLFPRRGGGSIRQQLPERPLCPGGPFAAGLRRGAVYELAGAVKEERRVLSAGTTAPSARPSPDCPRRSLRSGGFSHDFMMSGGKNQEAKKSFEKSVRFSLPGDTIYTETRPVRQPYAAGSGTAWGLVRGPGKKQLGGQL